MSLHSKTVLLAICVFTAITSVSTSPLPNTAASLVGRAAAPITPPTNGGTIISHLHTTDNTDTRPGPSELPAPWANITLKHVNVGRGVQNYTCASPTSMPLAIGAMAALYDITTLAFTSPDTLNAIPPTAAYLPLTSNLIQGYPLMIPSTSSSSVGSYPVIGSHYFTADGTPTFDLTTVREIFFGKKDASVKAPAGANVGPDGTGAVDWLALGDKGKSVGLGQVYRVVTAGGNPPASCQGRAANAVISVPYAAQYWFYG